MDSSTKDKGVNKLQPVSDKAGASTEMPSKDKPKSSPDKMQDKESHIKKPPHK